MKPGKLDLPTIWRGCDWGPVTLKWKDANGDPINIAAFRPRAQSLNINLNAVVSGDPADGITILALGKDQTSTFRLGVESWDWIWETNSENYRFPPFLSGKIQIKDPVTALNGDLGPPLPPVPEAPVARSASDITGTTFTANWDAVSGAGGYQLDVSLNGEFSSYIAGYRNKNVGFVNSYVVNGLAFNTTYYYRLRAFNTGGSSPNSNVVNLHTSPPPPPPGNDAFIHAIAVTDVDGNLAGTTVSATRETGEPAGDNSVWYKLPALYFPAFVHLTLNTNTCKLSVYTGTTVSNLHLVVSSTTNPPSVSFNATAQNYWVRVYKNTLVNPFIFSWHILA